MSELEAQIERIVRQVLAEMGASAPSPTPPGGQGAGGQEQGAGGGEQPAAPQSGDWVVTERVLTLARLPQQWDGVQRVVAPSGAVVTPAVHDELLRRGVTLAFGAEGSGSAAARRVRVTTVSRSYDAAWIVRAIGDLGFRADSERRECLMEATDRLAEELVGGLAAAVLVCRHTAAALCLANRHRGVRAVLALGPQKVAEEAEAVGANLLVLDPRAHSPFAVRQVLREFLQGIPRACPEAFRPRLA